MQNTQRTIINPHKNTSKSSNKRMQYAISDKTFDFSVKKMTRIL